MDSPRNGEDGWVLVRYDWRDNYGRFVYERTLPNGQPQEVELEKHQPVRVR